MALLTTGLIKNNEVSGVRPSSTLSIRMSNADPVSASIRVSGIYWTGTTNTEYVFGCINPGTRGGSKP